MKKRRYKSYIIWSTTALLASTLAISLTSCSNDWFKDSFIKKIGEKLGIKNDNKTLNAYNSQNELKVSDSEIEEIKHNKLASSSYYKITIISSHSANLNHLTFGAQYKFSIKFGNILAYYHWQDIEYEWWVYKKSLSIKTKINQERNQSGSIHLVIDRFDQKSVEQFSEGDNAIVAIVRDKKTKEVIGKNSKIIKFDKMQKDHNSIKHTVAIDMLQDENDLLAKRIISMRIACTKQLKANQQRNIKIYDAQNRVVYDKGYVLQIDGKSVVETKDFINNKSIVLLFFNNPGKYLIEVTVNDEKELFTGLKEIIIKQDN